jgi:hypothetical protein
LGEPPPDQSHGFLDLRLCAVRAVEFALAARDFASAERVTGFDQDAGNLLALAIRKRCFRPAFALRQRGFRGDSDCELELWFMDQLSPKGPGTYGASSPPYRGERWSSYLFAEYHSEVACIEFNA